MSDMTTHFDTAVARVANGADPYTEAAVLVAEMSVDEKLGCLDGDTPFWPGIADMTSGGYYRHTWPAAVVERLGIPGIHFSDGPRGAVTRDGTAFPVSMARGALFDPALEERVGDAIGLELRASGATYTGAVCMNLLRHPAWGRAQETYGEDPHHVGRMAAAFTRGLQRHVMACMKHFAANSMENARFSVDVSADERALHEVYLPHFRHVAAQGVASVMSAYNSLNGEWCGQDETLLTTILRDEWGWDGFVTSDFIFGLRDAVASVRAGLDIEMPFRQQRAMALRDALDDGRLDLDVVDRSVERTVATLLRFHHVFEHAPDVAIINCAPHRALARQVSAAATVMLRNDGNLLPIEPGTVSRIAVVGRLAGVPNLGDGGSSDIKSTTTVTPLDGIRNAFADAVVTHADGLAGDADRAAVEAADLVVVVVGYTKHDEGEFIDNSATMALAAEMFPPMDHPELGFAASRDVAPQTLDDLADAAGDSDSSEVGGMAPGGDRASLRLSAADEQLIAEVVALNPCVVAVVQCGSAVMMPWSDSVRALLVSWYPGVEGGNALGDILTGAAEPAGRLPFAIPTDEAHLVPFDRNATTASYELLHGQWKLDADGNEARFPFGAGAGFTTFDVGAAVLADDGSSVTIEVQNTGTRVGSTVVYAFAGIDQSTVQRPLRRLIGFRRVTAEPGESRAVTIDLDWGQLDVRRDGTWWTEPGTYRVHLGQDASALPVEVIAAR
jgi:beta-glucosidase